MIRRSVALVIIFSLITCGIYFLYWFYVTTNELKTVTGREELSPGVDLILNIVTCGIWSFYGEYRNAQIIHAKMLDLHAVHEDKATLILILNLAGLIVGVTGIVAMGILQDDLNNLCGRLQSAEAALRPAP